MARMWGDWFSSLVWAKAPAADKLRATRNNNARGRIRVRRNQLVIGLIFIINGRAGIEFAPRPVRLGAPENWRNVPVGTFKNGENLWRKLLIPGAGFWTDQWNQGVRLWKECLLSRGSDAY